MSIYCSPRQIEILRTVTGGNWFQSSRSDGSYTTALKLHDKGLLDRDPQNAYRFTCNAAGEQRLADHNAKLRSAA